MTDMLVMNLVTPASDRSSRTVIVFIFKNYPRTLGIFKIEDV